MAKKKTEADVNQHPSTVKIKLYKDRGKYANDVVVIINGMSFLIKRGVEVEVPYEVAEVLRNSDDLRAQTVDMMYDMQSDYESKSRMI